jgi:UDP-glucose 4-epimerase
MIHYLSLPGRISQDQYLTRIKIIRILFRSNVDMKIFITGITGFIGSNLWEHFTPSDEVYILARKPMEVKWHGLNVKVLQGDLSAPAGILEELKRIRPEICIHLAWEGIPDLAYERSLKNLQQSAMLLRCLAEECGCRKIIVAGSCFEYGKNLGPCREDEAVLLNSFFVWAKNSLLDLGNLLASKHNISFIWFRFFYVYGPGQRAGSLIPMMAEALKRNEQPMVKTPHNANDFIHVEDIAEALSMAAHMDVPTGIYNLGSGRSVPVWKVCEYLEMAMGNQPLYANQLRELKIEPTADFWADTSKSSTVLGWKARTGIEEGIRRYVKSMEIKV